MDKSLSAEISDEIFASYYLNHTRQQSADYFGITFANLLGRINKIRDSENSVILPLKCARWKNVDIPNKFSELQADILTGSMLGDGTCAKLQHTSCNSHFCERHGLLQQHYLKWKFDALMPFSSKFTMVSLAAKPHFINGRAIYDNGTCTIHTINHPLFSAIERAWYQRDGHDSYVFNAIGRRIKIVPDNLVLNPRIVAVWFCDDGENNSEQRYAKLHTDGFSFTEVEILVNKLKKMGITNCNVYHKKGAFKTKECPAIRIGSSSYLYFLDMIREFIPTQDVLYKVDISHYIHPIKMFGETHPLSLLNESQVLEIAKHLTNKRPIAEIASEYNVSPTTIGDIYNGKNWGCLNLNLKKDQDIPYNNNSGFSGVSEYKNGLWRSRIQVYYTNINLGHYKNKQDAITIRKLAEQLRDSGETNPEKFKQLKRDFQEKLAGQKNGGSV